MADTDNKVLTGASLPAIKTFVKSSSSHRNLLDNPWFTVNQRGWTTGDLSGGNYCVDRWMCNSGYINVTASSNGLTLKNTQTANRFLVQNMENYSYLVGKEVTISIMLQDGSVYGSTLFFPSSNYANKFLNGIEVRIYYNGSVFVRVDVNSTISLRAVKLELGSVSTLAYDSPPNYAEELLKCSLCEADSSDEYSNRRLPTKLNRTYISFSAGSTGQTIYGFKAGNVVHLTSGGDVSSLAINTTIVYTLPTSWRPYSWVGIHPMDVGGADYRVSIYANGEIGYHNYTGTAITSAHNFGWSTTYISVE